MKAFYSGLKVVHWWITFYSYFYYQRKSDIIRLFCQGPRRERVKRIKVSKGLIELIEFEKPREKVTIWQINGNNCNTNDSMSPCLVEKLAANNDFRLLQNKLIQFVSTNGSNCSFIVVHLIIDSVFQPMAFLTLNQSIQLKIY